MLFPNLVLLIPGLALVGGALWSAPPPVNLTALAAYTAGVILIAWAPLVTLAAQLKRERQP